MTSRDTSMNKLIGILTVVTLVVGFLGGWGGAAYKTGTIVEKVERHERQFEKVQGMQEAIGRIETNVEWLKRDAERDKTPGS